MSPVVDANGDEQGDKLGADSMDRGVGPIASYFKSGCPTSFSWPLDDPQSLFRCPDSAQNNGVGAANDLTSS
jgi:hypothetical protein